MNVLKHNKALPNATQSIAGDAQEAGGNYGQLSMKQSAGPSHYIDVDEPLRARGSEFTSYNQTNECKYLLEEKIGKI